MAAVARGVRETIRTRLAAVVVAAGVAGPALCGGTTVWAQPRDAQARFETIQIRPHIYVVFGAGGNVVVQTGADGPVVVNSGSEAMAERVVDAVKALTPVPIRYVLNTSADPEFVGGNAKVAGSGVGLSATLGTNAAAILAREEVLLRMSAPTGQTSPFPTEAWPTDTFLGRQKTLSLNGEAIQLFHMPAAHSDTDAIVHFRGADVLVTGDIVDLRRFPVIDVEQGGSVQGLLSALNRLLEMAVPPMPLVWQEQRTLIVPGHGRIMDEADLVEYRDMVTIVRDRVQHAIERGMTLDQVQASNPAAGFRSRYGSDTGDWTTARFVESIYKSLKGKS